MIKRQLYVLLVIVTAALSIIGCSNPAEPVKPSVTLPDTTSQSFKFDTFQFGDGFESATLNDVWIFDKNNIWAVGYIGADDGPATNILHWNGSSWERVGHIFTSDGMEGIWAQDSSHIYFASGNVARFINGNYEVMPMDIDLDLGQGINLLWGKSENDLWGVGPFGTIAHFDGKNWKKINFSTDWYFYKITGSTSNGAAYALARNSGNQTIIVELKNLSAKILYNSSESSQKLTAWTITMGDENNIYAAGRNIWELNLTTGQITTQYKSSNNAVFQQSFSQSTNDIYFLGSDNKGGLFVHYNGKRFTGFSLPASFDINGDIFAVDDLAISVGSASNMASMIKISRTE